MIVLTLSGASPSSGLASISAPAALTKASPDSCPYARAGVAFYRGRYVHHQLAREAPVPTWRKPRNCGDARYLSRVWIKRAYISRQKTEHWRAHRFDAVIDRLERGLAGTPMAGTGPILERYGRRYGVSPFFMVATAATESSIGHAACSNNRKNVWGLASCVNSWPVPYFETWDEAIAFYARFLSSRWQGHSTPYSFRGYAACDECWGRKVSEWMGRLFGVPSKTSYP